MSITKTGFNLRVIPDEINDVSQELKDSVPVLKKGSVRTYRLPVPIDQDHIKDDKGTRFLKGKRNKIEGSYTWPQSVLIPTIDEIKDLDGDTVKIGVVRSFDVKTGIVEPYPLRIEWHKDGYFLVHEGNVETERFYAYMELTDFNGSKPNRDTSKPIYFYTVDAEAESKKRGAKLDVLTEELQYVKNMTPAEVKLFAGSMMWDIVNVEVEVLRTNIKEFVVNSKNLGKLTEMHANKALMENKALIKKAITAGVISFSEMENKFSFTDNGKLIAVFNRIDGKDNMEQFAEWLQSAKDGNAVKGAIRNHLKQPELQED